jgi:NADH dehydrogenase/NADH:ubiquinone oxidoreductase subunit G
MQNSINIASDRLRDFFLMAKFGQTKKQYQKKNKERAAYAQPFKEAIQGASSNLQKCLVELSDIAKELQKHRSQRNRLVHRVATITARRSIDLLREQRRSASKTSSQAETPTFQDEALTPAIEAMKLWYRRLVTAGSLTFEFEVGIRKEQ